MVQQGFDKFLGIFHYFSPHPPQKRQYLIFVEVAHEGAKHKHFVSTFKVKSGGCQINISQEVEEETARGLYLQFTIDHLRAKSFA